MLISIPPHSRSAVPTTLPAQPTAHLPPRLLHRPQLNRVDIFVALLSAYLAIIIDLLPLSAPTGPDPHDSVAHALRAHIWKPVALNLAYGVEIFHLE